MLKNGSAGRKTAVLLLLALLLLFSIFVAVSAGAYPIGLSDVYGVVAAHVNPFASTGEPDKLHNTIVWEIRLPRILLALLVGAALAGAGAAYQGSFRNPLVDPYILGVSAGAAFGAALSIVRPVHGIPMQMTSLFFAGLAVFLAYTLSRTKSQHSAVTLILAGIIIDSLFFAFVSMLEYMSRDTQLREIVFWLMGGFYYASWSDVGSVAPVVLSCILLLWALGWKLNVLSTGDEEARSIGVNPERYRLIIVVLATVATAVSVSAVGIIAWVGLMLPHAARLAVGPDHRFMMPASAMLGGIYLIICDTLARTLTSSEIPVGIIASIIGAPYLIYLLRANARSLYG